MRPAFRVKAFLLNCFNFFKGQFRMKFVRNFILLTMACTLSVSSYSQCVTAVRGSSFIINMGFTPQSNASGLKPYGMIYDLITNYDVPILWCIKPTKVKDGVDFTYNWTGYSGGPFVVPVQYINAAVSARITYWLSQGVQGTYAIAGSFTPPIYDTLTSFPKVMIDNLSGNQNIITGYYANAGIPSSAYILGVPASLNGCYDIWTNPHDEPTWATHGYLYNFVTSLKGNIWAQCHEVSIMENVQNPVFPFQKLNFLSTTGLQCYDPGECGAATSHANNPILPETYQHPTDPIMQFIGTMGAATQNGSEQWYIPNVGGQWYPTTRRGVRTGNGTSPAEGVLLVYGPAYGNPANGTVMYEGGHNLNNSGTAAERVQAQKAYFNFVLYTGRQKKLVVNTTLPASFTTLNSYSVSAAVTSGTAPYTYQWTSSLGATFTNGNTANAGYTAPATAVDTMDYIRIRVTDACGRVNIKLVCVPVQAAPLPIDLLTFNLIPKANSVQAFWSTASEINNDYFNLERSGDSRNFENIAMVEGAGNSTYQRDYSFLDSSPLSGLSYYRLKQTDFDGRFSYSEIVPVKFNGNGFVVFPNPAYKNVTILVDQDREDKISVQLVDFSGRIVYRRTIDFKAANSNKFELDVSTFARGIYRLICTSENTTFIEPLLLHE